MPGFGLGQRDGDSLEAAVAAADEGDVEKGAVFRGVAGQRVEGRVVL